MYYVSFQGIDVPPHYSFLIPTLISVFFLSERHLHTVLNVMINRGKCPNIF